MVADFFTAERLHPVAQTSIEQGHADNQGGVADNGSDDAASRQGEEPCSNREDADDELGNVAKRCVKQAAGGGPNMIGELFGGLTDEGCQGDDADSGQNEERHLRRMHERQDIADKTNR